MRTGLSIWVLGAFLAVATLSSARAQEDDDWRPRDRVVAGQIQPLDRILPGIRRNHPGTFYDAEGPFQGPDGEMHYRLKWMTPEGRVIWFDANARTGRVLGAGVGRGDYRDSFGDWGDRRPQGAANDGGRNNFGPGDDGDGPSRDGGFGGDHDRGPGPDYGGARGQDWDRDGGGRGDWPGSGGRWQGGGGRGGWQGGGGHDGGGGGGGDHHGHGG